jgi:hypothetical protein
MEEVHRRRWRGEEESESERLLGRALAAALFVAAMILGALLAKARADVEPLDLAALVRGSDEVVVGRVASLACREGSFDGLGTILFTDVTIAVDRGGVLLGDAGPVVVVSVPGGEKNDVVLVCAEAPRFEVGDHVLVFVRDVGGEHRVWGLEAGTYAVDGDNVLGRAGLPIGERVRLADLARAVAALPGRRDRR